MGASFTLPFPGSRLHCVFSAQNIAEINDAHASQLSMHAFAKQVCLHLSKINRVMGLTVVLEIIQPKYTMNGFTWKDQRDIDGVVFIRAIRCMSHHLPSFVSMMRKMIDEKLSNILPSSPCNPGRP